MNVMKMTAINQGGKERGKAKQTHGQGENKGNKAKEDS